MDAASLSKEEMIDQIMALQQTLQDLSARVAKVDEENEALSEENAVLKDYIDNLLSKIGASSASETRR